jgi:hypothetical protein
VLTEGASEVIRRPGFVSVTILASLDGTKVENHAIWETQQDAKATQTDPAAAAYAKRAGAIGTASAAMYRVVAEIR